MDPSTLTDRIRDIVRVPARSPGPVAPPAPPQPGAGGVIERTLDGTWLSIDCGRCFVVERTMNACEAYGRGTIGGFATRLSLAAGEASLFARGGPAPPFIFFDLETTGLSGGAGSCAFLVGCGWFESDGSFVTRQYLLTRTMDERPMLEAVAHDLERAGTLVSFNGKSFDAPMLDTRYALHRLNWSHVAARAHLDVLHPARRFWSSPASADGSSSLSALEQQVLKVRRVGDVAGMDIPWRYFQFIRTGDARPLRPVLEHNRLDLVSLAGLTARLLHLVATGPGEAEDAREMLALGRTYAHAGRERLAHEAFDAAVLHSRDAGTAVEARRWLALIERRAGRHDEAATHWAVILNTPGCSDRMTREASQALAIHHEHRARDLRKARAFAVRSLELGDGRAWTEAARYRLARLDRKMAAPLLD